MVESNERGHFFCSCCKICDKVFRVVFFKVGSRDHLDQDDCGMGSLRSADCKCTFLGSNHLILRNWDPWVGLGIYIVENTIVHSFAH